MTVLPNRVVVPSVDMTSCPWVLYKSKDDGKEIQRGNSLVISEVGRLIVVVRTDMTVLPNHVFVPSVDMTSCPWVKDEVKEIQRGDSLVISEVGWLIVVVQTDMTVLPNHVVIPSFDRLHVLGCSTKHELIVSLIHCRNSGDSLVISEVDRLIGVVRTDMTVLPNHVVIPPVDMTSCPWVLHKTQDEVKEIKCGSNSHEISEVGWLMVVVRTDMMVLPNHDIVP
jgi:formylmethanofuran dehydrogenase subunit D